MKVAAVQMVSCSQLQTNLDTARRLLEQAAQAGAELAVLPEFFGLMGFKDTDKLAVQEVFGDGPVQQFLASAARNLGLWIVGGTLPITPSASTASTAAGPARVNNTVLVFSPAGGCVARYDKLHLFWLHDGAEQFDESRVVQAGTQPAMFSLPSRDGHLWRVGLSVCYDLRFPELYRTYAREGADLLLVPSAFTHTTGEAHWELLLRARAVENLAYVVAPAQGGHHENTRRTWGHSMVVDPWGDTLQSLPEGEGVVIATLDAARLQQVRAKLPALSHRVLP